jgi:hypothetical protein
MGRGWVCLGVMLIGGTLAAADDSLPVRSAILTQETNAATPATEAQPVSFYAYLSSPYAYYPYPYNPYSTYFVGSGFYSPFPTYATWPYYTYYGGPYYVYPNYATYVGTAYSAYGWGVSAPYWGVYPYYPYYGPSYLAYATSYQPYIVVP